MTGDAVPVSSAFALKKPKQQHARSARIFLEGLPRNPGKRDWTAFGHFIFRKGSKLEKSGNSI
jgi:hypothetical protein